MRLTCPNCKAQYEVDAAVIPLAGRDVQCSNCGQTWFQLPEAVDEAPPLRLTEADEAPDTVVGNLDDDLLDEVDAGLGYFHDAEPMTDDEPQADVGPEPVAGAAPGLEATTTPAETELADLDDDDDEDDTPASPLEAFTRRKLDDAVLNVLREEAERETTARQSEGASLETQTELGLETASDEPAPASAVREEGQDTLTVVNQAVAAMVAANGPAPTQAGRATKSVLLPDIDDINSTLRASSERGSDAAASAAPEAVQKRKSDFQRGFATSILVVAVLLLPYLAGNMIAASVPALAPAITAYSAAIDGLRSHLQDIVHIGRG